MHIVYLSWKNFVHYMLVQHRFCTPLSMPQGAPPSHTLMFILCIDNTGTVWYLSYYWHTCLSLKVHHMLLQGWKGIKHTVYALQISGRMPWMTWCIEYIYKVMIQTFWKKLKETNYDQLFVNKCNGKSRWKNWSQPCSWCTYIQHKHFSEPITSSTHCCVPRWVQSI